MQFQAFMVNIPIERAADENTTAFGAAILAGLAVGYWKDIDEVKGLAVEGRTFKPEMDKAKRKRLYRGWKAAVNAARAFKPSDDEDDE